MTVKVAEHFDGILLSGGVETIDVTAFGHNVTIDLPYGQRTLCRDIMRREGCPEISEAPGQHLDGSWFYRMKFRCRKIKLRPDLPQK